VMYVASSPLIVRHSIFRANQAVHYGSITNSITAGGGALRIQVSNGRGGGRPGVLGPFIQDPGFGGSGAQN
jgi:hypothetical protein